MKTLRSLPSENLATDRYDQQVTAQAIDILYVNMRMNIISNVLMMLVMLAVMWGRIANFKLFLWCAVAIAILYSRYHLLKLYQQHRPALHEAPRWGRFFAWTSLMNGLLWGSAGILFFVPDSAITQVFLYTCVIGMISGSMMISSYWLESYYAFIIPTLVLCALRLVAEGEGYQWLGFAMVLFAFVLARIAGNINAAALSAIRLRFENLELLERYQKEKEAAELASRDKTRFLASASHDLRQPIHALSLFSEALQAEVSSDKAKVLLDSMGRSIGALNQLLGSLLDISKLDADIVKPNLADFALRPLLEQLNEEYAPQAQAKGLDWKIQVNSECVRSDRALLETMLRNLISNAIRYTPSGGISVSCHSSESEVTIDVADTGLGIPQEMHKEIFREFYQLSNPERDRTQGLGLGLSIVERLSLLLKHRIVLESELGKGTRFSLVVPQAGMKTKELLAESDTSHHVIHGQGDLVGMRVLVIDDEAAVRESMGAVLQGWGCDARLAGSEEEALSTLSAGNIPQIILADYRLRDGKTGVQTIERIREESGVDIPVLIITGDTHPERLREVKKSGFALMHKPVQPAQLRTYLRRIRRMQT
ncbi:MAG: hybrid sensor histidine kinase/response regulator [Sideroxydans sp.]|nr:hybrid sensor histidine kinase/response regulator [Sideroxydans sp.]